MLDWALKYLQRGWSVVPVHGIVRDRCTCGDPDCPSPGKHPAVRWSEYAERLPTRLELEAWFSDSLPLESQFNVGLVTGEISGVVVVDADGEEGIRSLQQLGLKGTLTSRTGGGGYHLFYRAFDKAASRIGFRPGLDFKGEHGFVVLPPSMHNSGRRYTWVRLGPPAEADLSKLSPPPEAGFNNNAHAWYMKLLPGVDKGSRSVSAAKLAGRYFRLGLRPQEVWLMLVAWNTMNRPPLRQRELKATVSAVYKKHRRDAEIEGNAVTTLADILRLLKEPRVKGVMEIESR